MAEYIYFCTSLPALRYGVEPPLRSEQFCQSASTLLSVRDYDNLRQLDFSRAAQRVAESSFFWPYYAWEVALRNQVLALRAKKLGTQGVQRTEGPRRGGVGSAVLAAAVEQALARDPLSAEGSLDQLRWGKLCELASTHLYDMTFLASYALQLKLLERAALWCREPGEQQYERVCAEVAGKQGSGLG